MRFNFTWYFLSFKGRISRQEFCLGYFLMVALVLLLNRPLEELMLYSLGPTGRPWYRNDLDVALTLPMFVFALVLAWPTWVIFVKRFHDLNHSGWWLLLWPALALLARLTNIDRWNLIYWAGLIALCAIPGSRAANRFGDDPRAPARGGPR
jgi:uncharacterized membrane protein YhaH (DUF805 family)